MISVIIPFHKNSYGLVYTLTMLQNQTVAPDKIVIIDTSPNKTGLTIARSFNYNTVPIIVEVAQVNIYKAWNKGIELSAGYDCLIINDDLIFPLDLIEKMKEASEEEDALIFVPQTPSARHESQIIDRKFDNFSKEVVYEKVWWMPGFCFMLTSDCIKEIGKFDERYEIWFGDTDYERRAKNRITQLKGVFVYHFGGRSYGYRDPMTLTIIAADRLLFSQLQKI